MVRQLQREEFGESDPLWTLSQKDLERERERDVDIRVDDIVDDDDDVVVVKCVVVTISRER